MGNQTKDLRDFISSGSWWQAPDPIYFSANDPNWKDALPNEFQGTGHLEMAEDFRSWINALDLPKRKYRLRAQALAHSILVTFHFYSSTTEYGVVLNTESHGYLAAVALSRKRRPAEDWHRGSDLPDGRCDKETWERIMAAIIRYELVDIPAQKAPVAEGP